MYLAQVSRVMRRTCCCCQLDGNKDAISGILHPGSPNPPDMLCG